MYPVWTGAEKIMRKRFWVCLTCGVVLVGSVISTAHFAARHPESVIGRVLHGASYAAIIVNPVGGLAPLAQEIRARDPEAAETLEVVAGDPVPADPEPVLDDKEGHGPCAEPDELTCKPVAPGPIVETGGVAPIVIEDEKEGAVSLPMPQTPAGSFDPAATEVPGSVVEVGAPATMPLCQDQEDCELLPMPRMEPELLPMPHPEEEQEEIGWMDLNEEQLLNFFRRGIEEQLGGIKEGDSPAVEPECREDCNRHQDYPGCPHGGCPGAGKSGPAGPHCKPHQPADDSIRPATHKSEEPSERQQVGAAEAEHLPRQHPRRGRHPAAPGGRYDGVSLQRLATVRFWQRATVRGRPDAGR
jgi:hypothetical protein